VSWPVDRPQAPAQRVTRLAALVPNAPRTQTGVPDNVAAALINWMGGYNAAAHVIENYTTTPDPTTEPKT